MKTNAQQSRAHSQSVTLELIGLTNGGELEPLSITMEIGSPCERESGIRTWRTLEDVAKAFAYALCVSASLHYHGGAFVSLEGQA